MRRSEWIQDSSGFRLRRTDGRGFTEIEIGTNDEYSLATVRSRADFTGVAIQYDGCARSSAIQALITARALQLAASIFSNFEKTCDRFSMASAHELD